MNARERFQLADSIFREVCDLDNLARESRLAELCRDDPDLESDVRALLTADSGTLAGALDTPAVATGAFDSIGDDDPVPERIGRFQIVRRLGAGGMGVVYEAVQESPKRTVALKVVRSGAFSRAHRRRFELEAQLLARLQHPGIATIYETGTADTGAGAEPFFAMELIEGVPLTEHVRASRLTRDETLALFTSICDAVHHAHQKGVIHRDLKPGNILVTRDGSPKILDFGVARLAEPEGETLAMHTSEGQLVGTLAYMSPEQVAGDPNALDTRSDVYSLGVILFELLAGQPPHEVNELTLPTAIKLIAESSPPRLGSIAPPCRGDVETIVAKALETDRERRYDSAASLASDVRRFLADEPISARPPTTVYQLRKFARRNRGLVTSVGAIVAVLALSSVVLSVLALRAAQARTQAESALARAERDNENYAAVLEFLQDMIRRANPAETGGDELTLREALDRAVERIEVESAKTPAVDAAIRETVGETYNWLGGGDRSAALLQRSLELFEAEAGPLSADATRVRRKLSRTLSQNGQSDRALQLVLEIEPSLRDAVEAGEPRHEELARTLHAKAIALKELDDLDAAGPVIDEAIELYRVAGLSDDGAMGDALNSAGAILLRKSDHAGALPVLEQAVEYTRRNWGENHARTAIVYNNLSLAARYLGRMDEAETYARNAYDVWLNIAGGKPHEGLLSPEFNLGVLLSRRGKTEEAISLLEASVRHHDEIFNAQHERQAFVMDQLARMYGEVGRLDDAAALLQGAREILTRSRGERHPYIAINLTSIARLRMIQGRFEDAESLNREALAIYLESRGPDHPWTATGQLNLAESLAKLGRAAEAKELLAASIGITEAHSGPSSPELVRPLQLAADLHLRDDPDVSERNLRRAIEIEQSGETTPIKLAALRSALGEALAHLGRREEAEALLLDCQGIYDSAEPPATEQAALNAARLAALYETSDPPAPDLQGAADSPSRTAQD